MNIGPLTTVPTFDEDKSGAAIAKLRRKEEEDTAKLLAERYAIPYADLSTIPVNVDALALVREEDARGAAVAVIQKSGKRVEVGVHNPEDPRTKAVLEDLRGRGFEADLFLVSAAGLERVWAGYAGIARRGKVITGEVEVSSERLNAFRERVRVVGDVADLLGTVDPRRAGDVLEILLAGALGLGASDIHLEPQSSGIRIRYRLDGVLADISELPAASYRFLLSRIKLISDIKLNVQAKGQDGRFTIKAKGAEIEVRSSTLPGPYGENVVLRVLDPKTIALGLGELGMQPQVEALMAKELARPNGMILATGPTGSGKTTTLYAFIREVHKPGVKIITLEDPVEYHLAGIEQTQVEAERGYDFADGLRSILRQDPDVILVGEIRDLETAQTAMHAALTGHLVFTTLHTNNAAGTIPRLLDLGVDPAIMAPAINAALAQRLVRKLCQACRRAYSASPEERRLFAAEIAGLPAGALKPKLGEPLTLWKAGGCGECNGTGYKGRIGVFEIILIDDTIEQMVFKKPSEVEIKEAARRQGQITLRQDGIYKVLAGITDLAEVERVVGAG